MCAVYSLQALTAFGLKLEDIDRALAALNLKISLGGLCDLTGLGLFTIVFFKL